LLFTCAASPRTLSLAASLDSPRQRQAGRLELSRMVTSRLATTTLPHEKDASLRLLQPTPFTSTLRTVRFLVASWFAPRSVLRRPATRVRRLTLGRTVGGLPPSWPGRPPSWELVEPLCRMSLPGGASLDGEPPASVFATTITRSPKGACGVERGPGGAPIDGSSALHLPVAVFSTARRARDVASDALCRAPRRIRHRCRIPIAPGRRTRLCRRLVKDVGVRRLRAPSIAECSLPRARLTLARHARGITRSPPPVSLLACSWLSPPRTGFQRLFAHGARTLARASQRARPMASRPGPSAARRLLQTQQSASTTTRPPEPRVAAQGSESLRASRAAPSRRTVRVRSPTLTS